MSDLSRALGLPETIEWKGKKYLLSALEIEIIGMYEQWLKQRAVDVLRRMKHMLQPDEYERRFDSIIRDAASGVYDLFSEAGQKSLRSLDGIKYMVWLRLQKHHPGTSEEEVEAILTDQFNEVLSTMKGMDSDPNPLAPAKTGADSTGGTR